MFVFGFEIITDKFITKSTVSIIEIPIDIQGQNVIREALKQTSDFTFLSCYQLGVCRIGVRSGQIFIWSVNSSTLNKISINWN